LTHIPGEIYFVREIDRKSKGFTGFVKIGLVRASERRNSFNRLREHQTGNPRALQILKKEIISTEAVDRVEALLHRLYAKQRVSGEWFEFKSELQVQEAIKRTKAFAKEVAKIVPVFDEAEALGKAQDNDKSIPATDQHKKLLETIAIANLEISEIKVLESVIDAKFAEAVKAGVSGMDKVVKTQIRTIKPFFDEDAFKQANPKIYAKYLVPSQKWYGRFLSDAKAKKSFKISQDFESFLREVESQIAAVKNVEESAALNEPLLALTQRKALSTWEHDVADAQLRVACGKNQAILGICKWERRFNAIDIFNEGLFQEENPQLWADYLTDATTGTHLISRKRKIG